MRCHRTLAIALLLALSMQQPTATRACTIDNTASLTADGVYAMRTAEPPRRGLPWAPFTVAEALAPGVAVLLVEQPGDLARALPARVRSRPYRWDFLDGSTALGRSATHRYGHVGIYQLRVSGYDSVRRRWLTFDSAIIRVVTADSVLGANATYQALRATVFLTGVTWPAEALLVLLVVAILVRRWPHPQVRSAGPGQGDAVQHSRTPLE